MNSLKKLLPLVVGMWFGVALCASGVSVGDLRCEYLKAPLGIDVIKPRLSWVITSRERNTRQMAYQILVASSSELLSRNQGDLWDSGKVDSDQSIHVDYAGKNLGSGQACFWKVRVWGNDGVASKWSAPAQWSMGLLNADDWKGQWIGNAPPADDRQRKLPLPAPLLRKTFPVNKPVRRATVYLCGLGYHELNLNGAKVGEDLLTPGWTDYNETTLYDTHDVTRQLGTGQNAIGLALGNGMYHVERRNRFAKFTGSFGPLRACLRRRKASGYGGGFPLPRPGTSSCGS